MVKVISLVQIKVCIDASNDETLVQLIEVRSLEILKCSLYINSSPCG